MEQLSLKYGSERDKACGIAGMAITLVVCHGAHLLSEVDFDAEPGSNMRMAGTFAVPGNPRMSAKAVWEQSLKDLRAVISMVLGNVACRRLLGTGAPASADAPLRLIVREQALNLCSLEPDEADALYADCQRYVRRIFGHQAVPAIADTVSRRIMERHRLSAAELVELLAGLGIR